MTDYHHVWAHTEKCWNQIDYRQSQLLTVLTVGAWIGMVAFFVFVSFSLLTQNDNATIAMLLSLAVWLFSGISAIRIRRGRRKFLRIQ